MIAALRGLVDSTAAGSAIIDVGGVGYQIFASARTLAALPATGVAVKVLIETHVREDHIHLYGFADTGERDWFRLLTTVQGVGARVALAILSVLTPTELVTAIAAQDRALITRADGVGPKLATRILTELKDKAGTLTVSAALTSEAGSSDIQTGPISDAVSALVNLGYGRSDAFGAVGRAAQAMDGEPSVEALITAGLKELSA